jgi:hypothetical protein
MGTALTRFLTDESILRDPTADEIRATEAFLAGPLSVDAVLALQAVYAPDMPLRTKPGMDVRVGRYVAPRGCTRGGRRWWRGLGDVDALDAPIAAICGAAS